MNRRVVAAVFTVIVLCLLTVGYDAAAQQLNPCVDVRCHAGYQAVLQQNGTCKCIFAQGPRLSACDNTACPTGYGPVVQSNGSCMCVALEGPEPATCDSTSCGQGYRAEMQMNGSCLCVAVDCTTTGGCPEPPRAVEDGNPPPTIKP